MLPSALLFALGAIAKPLIQGNRMSDDRAMIPILEELLWLGNGLAMSCGSKWSPCFLRSRPNQKAVAPARRTASAWWALCSCCAPGAPGTMCPLNWAAGMDRPAGVASGCGPRRMYGNRSGSACWPNCARRVALTFPVASSTAPQHVRFLGGSHWAKSHRPWQERHQTPSSRRRRRDPVDPPDHTGQRARWPSGHCAAGRDSAHSRVSRAAALSPQDLAGRPGVRVGTEHLCRTGARRVPSAGAAPGSHARFRLGSHPLGRGEHSVVVQQSSAAQVVLRAQSGKPPGLSPIGCSADLRANTRQEQSRLKGVLQ